MTVRDPAVLECREVVELVTEFLGDALTPLERARLEQHLLACPPCSLHVAAVKATIARVAELREAPPSPEDVGPALLDVFRQWKQKGGGA